MVLFGEFIMKTLACNVDMLLHSPKYNNHKSDSTIYNVNIHKAEEAASIIKFINIIAIYTR